MGRLGVAHTVAGTPEQTPDQTPELGREESLEALKRQLETVLRDAAVIRERLARLSEVERFRPLSDAERALTAEWHLAVRSLTEEMRNLEDRISSAP